MFTVRLPPAGVMLTLTQKTKSTASLLDALELCGLVEARVIDLDGVYDPCRPNDRLLLGMKGEAARTVAVILAPRTAAERADLAIFAGVWPHSSLRLLLKA
jgi:hypothetical protein